MVERQGGGNAAGVIRMTPAANYPANLTEPIAGLVASFFTGIELRRRRFP